MSHDSHNRPIDPPDAELVSRSREARDAFDALVHRHYRMVYAAAYSYVAQRETAEEIAQEAFLRAYLHLHTLNSPAAFGGWIVRIARNLAENWRVKGQTRSRLAMMVPLDDEVIDIPDSSQASPREQMISEQETAAVYRALNRLPQPDRELVMLHFLEGLSKSDLARRLGVVPSTVGRQLDRALALLRQDLGGLFPQVGQALAPGRKSVVRVSILIAAANALTGPAKAALQSASSLEGATPVIAASSKLATMMAAQQERFINYVTVGGRKMFAAQFAVAGMVGVGVLRATLPDPAPSPAVYLPQAPVENIDPLARIVAANSGAVDTTSFSGPAISNRTDDVELQLIANWEAEKCKISSKHGRIEEDVWANSGRYLSRNWGDVAGDSIEWEAQLESPLDQAKLAVRYAFHKNEFIQRPGAPQGDHVAHLYINNLGPYEITFSDTWRWKWFKIATIELPVLEAGVHSFKLVVPADRNVVDIDNLAVYQGTWTSETTIPELRPNVLRWEHQRMIILSSPTAVLPEDSATILAAFSQLRRLMEDDFGREPYSFNKETIHVHFTDPPSWHFNDIRAIKNRSGIFLLGDGKSTRADWCWGMAEYFTDPRVPRWFKDSTSRVSGLLDWLPALESDTLQAEDQMAAEMIAEARQFLADENTTTTRVEVVHTALRNKHGEDIFRKFWHAVHNSKPQQLRDMGVPEPGRGPVGGLDKVGIMAILSYIAGEDVTPLYRRWSGFANEGPVDPLILSGVQ